MEKEKDLKSLNLTRVKGLAQVTRSISIRWCDQREGCRGYKTLPSMVQSQSLWEINLKMTEGAAY